MHGFARGTLAMSKGRKMTKPLDDFSDLVAKGRALRHGKSSETGKSKFLDDDQATVELECAANIKREPIVWLWKDWLARGKLHVLAGIPGVGKSTIAFKIAAAISSGGRLPAGIKAEQGTVIIWSAEDEAKDTIRPRLEASGADLTQVHIVRGARDRKGKRAFDPSRDIAGLLAAIKSIGGAAMIIVTRSYWPWPRTVTRMRKRGATSSPLLIWRLNLVRLYWA
jgi:hypothetical protein